MHRLLLAFATASIVAAPAFAQSQSPAQAPADQAPAAQQKTETKRVCQNVQAERATGSRLGSTTRVCKMVEVPVEGDAEAKDRAGGTAHAH
jgi:hypothetical protein